MKVYLASGYSQRSHMRTLASLLSKLGHHCTSQWIYREDDDEGHTEQVYLECANEDLQGIEEAEGMLVINPDSSTKGGLNVEIGYALALKKPIVIIGNKVNVFHHLVPSISHDVSMPYIVGMEMLKEMQAAIKEAGCAGYSVSLRKQEP